MFTDTMYPAQHIWSYFEKKTWTDSEYLDE